MSILFDKQSVYVYLLSSNEYCKQGYTSYIHFTENTKVAQRITPNNNQKRIEQNQD